MPKHTEATNAAATAFVDALIAADAMFYAGQELTDEAERITASIDAQSAEAGMEDKVQEALAIRREAMRAGGDEGRTAATDAQ